MLGKKTGGRRPGSRNKKAVKRELEASAAGIMPIDLMLATMRFAYGRALELQGLAKQVADENAMTAEGQAQLFGEVMRFRGIAQDWAKECANYFHPKMASVTLEGDADNPILGPTTDAQRWKAMKEFLIEFPGIAKDPEIKKLLQ